MTSPARSAERSCTALTFTATRGPSSAGSSRCACDARLAQDPPPDRNDQAGLLGEPDEATWLDPTLGRVLPPHERLDAAHPAGLDLDDRLVVQEQLRALEHVREIAAELEPVDTC